MEEAAIMFRYSLEIAPQITISAPASMAWKTLFSSGSPGKKLQYTCRSTGQGSVSATMNWVQVSKTGDILLSQTERTIRLIFIFVHEACRKIKNHRIRGINKKEGWVEMPIAGKNGAIMRMQDIFCRKNATTLANP